MNVKCLIFGHSYKKISIEKSTIEKGKFAKHEYDEFDLYKCSRCGKKIYQEEYYQ